VDYDPFSQVNLPQQFILRPRVVQIWSRNTPECGVNETRVLHQVDHPFHEGLQGCLAHKKMPTPMTPQMLTPMSPLGP